MDTVVLDDVHYTEHGHSELLSWCWENIEGIGMVLLPGRAVKPEAVWTMKYLPPDRQITGRQVEFNFVRGSDATMFSLRWA
jgi:hypothetical protein